MSDNSLPPDSESGSIAPLAYCVRLAVEAYLRDLGGTAPDHLYQLVITEVERPLLETVLSYVEGNQSQAARLLGINRTTLHRKLLQHSLESSSK